MDKMEYLKVKTTNKSKSKGNTIEEAENHSNPNEENATEIDDKELCIALLEALKKQTVLWKVNERTKFKNVNEKYYKIVANEVNLKLKSTLTWEDARRHIKSMRDHYTQEMQKQALEEDFELPWYSEHMAFLQENIKLLLRRRKTGPRYTPLKTMDDSQLSILIDVYKKHDSLWQVNNIAFGAKRKKEEAFEKIVEELNSNYNQNVTVAYLHRRVSYMLRTYSENKKLQLNCELEKRSFQPSTPLYEKMSFLSDCQGPFKCSQCDEIIERYDNYRIHVAKHDDTVPFPCPICKSSFQKFGYYIIHARRHMDLNIHFCKFCNKGFPFTTELEIHERSHTGELPYLCQICGAKFRAPHSYRNHIRRHENRFLYECHICSHGFNHSNELNDHVKAHLNIRDIVCNVCDKSFTSKKRLRIHQHIHSEEKRYKCTVCGKAFSQASGLRQHRKQHQPFSVLHKKESTLNFGNI